MKIEKYKKLSTILVLALTLFITFAVPGTVKAQTGDNGDKIVFGGRFRLQSGETINGSLFVIGGTAILEQDSSVNGDVVLVGGSLEISGTINGSVNAIGATISLLDTALINGDVNITSVSLTKSPNASIMGSTNENMFNLDDFQIGNIPHEIGQIPTVSPANTMIQWITKILWACLRILAMSVFAALVVLLAEKPTSRVSQSIVSQPVIAGAYGILTAIVAPLLLVVLMITIILIPISLIALVLLGLAGLFGWVAIGYEIGRRMEKSMKQTWAPAISAGLGTMILTLGGSLFSLIPCVGWTIPGLISIVGFGGVLISKFGTTVYVSNGGRTINQPPVQTAGQADEIIDINPSEDNSTPPINRE